MHDVDEFIALMKSGNIAAARKILEEQMKKVRFAPDTITVKKDGTGKYTKKRKEVELGPDGIWRLKAKTASKFRP